MVIDPNGALPEELVRATEKLRKADKRSVKFEGGGAGTAARKLAQKHIKDLSDGVERILRGKNPENVRKLLPRVRELDPDVLALCILQGAIHGISRNEVLVPKIVKTIGEFLHNECWAGGLIRRLPQTAESITNYAQNKSPRLKAKQKVAKTEAEKAGYKSDAWDDPSDYIKIGTWAVNALTTVLPTVFTTSVLKERRAKHLASQVYLRLTDEAEAYLDDVVAEVIRNNPVWLPRPDKPPDWTALNKGGSSDPRLRLTLIRKPNAHQPTAQAIQTAIKSGQMQPVLDAVNSLQSVPWKINERVLAVMKAHPPVQKPEDRKIPYPEETKSWAEMSDAEKRHRARIKKANNGFKSDYTLFKEDMGIAECMAEHSQFYTAMNLDWRGRVYGVPNFNFQQRDRVRALFLFAERKSIGEEGLYWLKVHVANSGDFNKISKRPFKERVEWVDDNLDMIREVARDPLADNRWPQADAPYSFLAACFELSSALEHVPNYEYETSLPVVFDGSCNSIQHQCAMMCGPEGALVNLLPGDPQDIYETVASVVQRRVEADRQGIDVKKQRFAKQWINYGITRKLVKHPAMTFGYGSPPGGMTRQLYEDVMEEAVIEVLEGKREEHPFGDDEDKHYWKASSYLAQHVYAAVKTASHSSASVKSFLKRLSNALSNENKPLRWTSAAGLPLVNLYQERPEHHSKQLKLWLHDLGVYVKTHLKDYLPSIDKKAAADGAPPNFVHSFDAAHLMLTVNAAVSEGITSVATVHDSFGCLAPDAPRFREIIREQFAQMYTDHNVLEEVLGRARLDLGEDGKGLPDEPPTRGDLDIQQVRYAEYAFA